MKTLNSIQDIARAIRNLIRTGIVTAVNPDGDLDRQLRDAVDKLDREKRARQRSNMRLD